MSAPEINPEISYSDALQRLKAIVNTLQSPNCNIDDMVSMTREAAALINLCRSRLVTTQEALDKVLADLRTQE